MFKYRALLALIVFATIRGLAADRNIPAGYYNKIDGKAEADLKNAVAQVINPHTEVSGYYNLPQYFRTTDVRPESSRWWDMYSDVPLYAPSFKGLNREHSFPKSWWGGDQTIPAYTDLNHLYPTEASANMAKSNYPLGEVDPNRTIDFDNGLTTVGFPVYGQGGGAKLVFEPDDEYKGDFARTYMYMATCCQSLHWRYTYMVENNTYPTLNAWSRDLLLRWAREDQVSQREIDRNEAVYSFQNNRNPFIDFPELMEYIWGNRKGEAFVLSEHMSGEASGDPMLINPTQDSTLEFGEVAEGHTATARLHLNGQNLKAGTLRLQIYNRSGENGADHFDIDGQKSTTVSTSAVNAPDGLWVTVEYAPKAQGEHTTRLLITGGGIAGSVGVGLRGECLPLPELTAPTATAATDITPTSYTANWTPVEGETVDYWVVNRTIYAPGAPAATQQLVAEDPYLPVTDFSGSESYTVQSVRLGVMSPQSNSVSVSSAGITAPEADNVQVAFAPAPGGVVVMASGEIDALSILAPSGRVVKRLAEVADNDFIELPAGVYIITTNKSTPVKLIVKSE